MRKILLGVAISIALASAPAFAAKGSESVRKAQEALKSKGFDPGPVDGVVGAKTRAAVREYQKQNKIRPTGHLGGETYGSLGVERGDAGKHVGKAGGGVKRSYAEGGKDIGQGGKDLGSNLKKGKVTDAATDFGKGVGSGAAKIGKGTGSAAKSAAKGVKDAFTPSKKK